MVSEHFCHFLKLLISTTRTEPSSFWRLILDKHIQHTFIYGLHWWVSVTPILTNLPTTKYYKALKMPNTNRAHVKTILVEDGDQNAIFFLLRSGFLFTSWGIPVQFMDMLFELAKDVSKREQKDLQMAQYLALTVTQCTTYFPWYIVKKTIETKNLHIGFRVWVHISRQYIWQNNKWLGFLLTNTTKGSRSFSQCKLVALVRSYSLDTSCPFWLTKR